MVAVFDIGGSHISHGYFNPDSSSLIDVGEEESSSLQTGNTSPLAVLVSLAEKSRSIYGASLAGLGVAVPGPFDYGIGVSQMQHKLISLYGLDLREILSQASGVAGPAITFCNDADAFLLGAMQGAGASAGRSVGITLGTGIGAAFAEGSTILAGGDGVPPGGEIWNLPYGQGIVEDAISTQTLEAEYKRRTGAARSVKSIAEAAAVGEVIAFKVFSDFGEQLARVLENVCTAFDPDRILVGGGISAAQSLFLPAVRSNRWCADRVSIVQERDSAPLMGAGVAWRQSGLQRNALLRN